MRLINATPPDGTRADTAASAVTEHP